MACPAPHDVVHNRTHAPPERPGRGAKRAQILEKEKPDAILPTMGGQTGLNVAKELAESGVLDRLGIELIGAKLPSIDRAEDRDLFKKARAPARARLSRSACSRPKCCACQCTFHHTVRAPSGAVAVSI